jgi:hypothetical protein
MLLRYQMFIFLQRMEQKKRGRQGARYSDCPTEFDSVAVRHSARTHITRRFVRLRLMKEEGLVMADQRSNRKHKNLSYSQALSSHMGAPLDFKRKPAGACAAMSRSIW